ncbi:MAG: hypothetical protein WA964_20295, partial [Ilumatobacter sp.]
MLTAAIVVPLLAAVGLLFLTNAREEVTRWVSVGAAAVPLALLIGAWIRFERGSDEMFQLVEEVDWIPSIGVAWRVGIDGISLSLALLAALLFVVAIAYPFDMQGR